MASRILGYRMRLIMPDNLSIERRQVMRAFGAELILVSQNEGMEGARDLALEMDQWRKVFNRFRMMIIACSLQLHCRRDSKVYGEMSHTSCLQWE